MDKNDKTHCILPQFFLKKISRPIWRGIQVVELCFFFFQSNVPEVYESEETMW